MTSDESVRDKYRDPLPRPLTLALAQAVCGDDHLMCSWPNCKCTTTKQKINAVCTVVAERINSIKSQIADAFD